MMKRNKWDLFFSTLVLLLPVAIGVILWDQLPDRIATHWGLEGTPDGWSGKGMAVFGIPLMLLAMHWLAVLITGCDKRNKEQSPKVFRLVLWIIPVMSVFLCSFVYLTALGWAWNVKTAVCMMLGLLFVVIGNYLPKCRQNHFIGVRIKWTLQNEENWNMTHRFAGKLWLVGGLLLVVVGFLPPAASAVGLMAVVLLMVLLPVIYSGWYHKKKEQPEN